MSIKIKSLLFKNIRAYRKTTEIQLDENLNIFVGNNGAGKTTIIEVINYLLSSDLPPKTRLKDFLNIDSTFAKLEAVVGDVDNQYTLRKALQKTNNSVKTVENTVSLNVENEMKKIKSCGKISDVEKNILHLLNISKPILNNILLLHQLESMWIFTEENMKIKQRIDGIFDNETHSKFIKQMKEELKNLKGKLELHRQKYEFLTKQLSAMEELERDIKKNNKILIEKTEREQILTERLTSDTDRIKVVKREIDNFENKINILRDFKYDIILRELPDKKYLHYGRHKIEKLIEATEKKSEVYLKYKHNLEKLELAYRDFQVKIDTFMNFYENNLNYSFDDQLVDMIKKLTDSNSQLNKKITSENLIAYFEEKINNLNLEDDSLRDRIYQLKITSQKYRMYEREYQKYENIYKKLDLQQDLRSIEENNSKLEREYADIMRRKNSELYFTIAKYKNTEENFLKKLEEEIKIATQRKDIFYVREKIQEFNRRFNIDLPLTDIDNLKQSLIFHIEKYENYCALKYSVKIFENQKELGLENNTCQLCTLSINDVEYYSTVIDDRINIIKSNIKKYQHLEKFADIILEMKKVKNLLKKIETIELPENQKSVENLNKIKAEYQLYLENRELLNHRSTNIIQQEISKGRKILTENIKNEQVIAKYTELKNKIHKYDIENINAQLTTLDDKLKHIQANKTAIFTHFNNLKSTAKNFINLIVEIRNNDFKENSAEYNIDLLKTTLHYKASELIVKDFPEVHDVKEQCDMLKTNIVICTEKLQKGNSNIEKITRKLFEVRGELKQLNIRVTSQKSELRNQYSTTRDEYKRVAVDLKILEYMVKDICKIVITTERTITNFMNKKIEELNFNLKKISNQLLVNDFFNHIQFRVNMDRSYSFKLEMYCNGQYMDMKTHSSAGQQTIAALIFRLGLIETFVRQNTIIILDEPTANLDRIKIDRLSDALVQIFKKSNHQFILISHDTEFIERINIHTNPNIFLIKNTDKSSSAVLKH